MNRNYEAIVIFRPEEDQLSQGSELVKKEFKDSEIELTAEEDMGLRELAYDIKKQRKGHYINFKIQSSPEKIKTLEKNMKLHNQILKFVFFREEEK